MSRYDLSFVSGIINCNRQPYSLQVCERERVSACGFIINLIFSLYAAVHVTVVGGVGWVGVIREGRRWLWSYV